MAVDYVKTGVPARMPRELVPRKWPHFMEKIHKPKEQQYTSHKVLGKLYDQVERVDFVPAFSNPFDKRIILAYTLDDQVLQDAAGLKCEYDAAMRRIMAQHDIKTEFEVWSTFVLHHSNQSKDYKFHEEIGQISSALKDQYRVECYRKVGSKDFTSMGPFVAAMYKVTSIEMSEAIRECNRFRIVGAQEERVRNMTAESMPLMSFPWLFHDILGKIANGNRSSTEDTTDAMMSPQRYTKHTPPKKSKIDQGMLKEEDVLETAEGVTHRGEVLELFDRPSHQDGDSDTTPKSNDTSSSSAKPPQNTPSASADEMADVPAIDGDAWSSTDSGSGEIIRVYQGSDFVAPRTTKSRPDGDLLMDLGDEFGKSSGNAVESTPDWKGLIDLEGDMENKELLGNITGILGLESGDGADKDKITATLIADVSSFEFASQNPKQHSLSAPTGSSPQAARCNHDREDLLDLSEVISLPQVELSNQDAGDSLDSSEKVEEEGVDKRETAKEADAGAVLIGDIDLLDIASQNSQQLPLPTRSTSSFQAHTPETYNAGDLLDFDEEFEEHGANKVEISPDVETCNKGKTTKILIGDIVSDGVASPCSQPSYDSAPSVPSPKTESSTLENQNGENLLELSYAENENVAQRDKDDGVDKVEDEEDEEAEEVIIELDLKPSLLDQLAKLNAE